MKRMAILAAVATLSVGAQAANLFWSGDTTGGPTFNRPVSLTGLSGVGTAVAYQVQVFHVTVSGDYEFEAHADTLWDTYILLYEGGFDPNSPLTNIIGGDDDFGGSFTMLTNNGGVGAGIGSSKLDTPVNGFGAMSLTAGVNYYAVVTGFGNADFGAYDAAIGNGQGDVIAGAVPEPTTMAIFGLGAAALAARKRRKS